MPEIVVTFLEKWVAQHPHFTGSMELHFHDGSIKDIKTHQSHRDVLTPPEQKKWRFSHPLAPAEPAHKV